MSADDAFFLFLVGMLGLANIVAIAYLVHQARRK